MNERERAAYAEENIAYWTGRAPGYSAVNQEELSTSQHRVWGKLLAEKIKARWKGRRPEDIQVLDVGTGPGFFAIVLAEMGYSVTAVDYTAEMLKEARENAGTLGKKIRFMEMNAEELSFPSECFDVVVSRNLTWNLPHPKKAYCQWVRVLKPGGLLLNFDANWYRYLYDPEAEAAHRRDRENVVSLAVEDDTAGTDVEAMEAIARKAPLSALTRPAWDMNILDGLGMDALADCGIWKQVWTETERINNQSTPMFMICGVKRKENVSFACYSDRAGEHVGYA